MPEYSNENLNEDEKAIAKIQSDVCTEKQNFKENVCFFSDTSTEKEVLYNFATYDLKSDKFSNIQELISSSVETHRGYEYITTTNSIPHYYHGYFVPSIDWTGKGYIKKDIVNFKNTINMCTEGVNEVKLHEKTKMKLIGDAQE